MSLFSNSVLIQWGVYFVQGQGDDRVEYCGYANVIYPHIFVNVPKVSTIHIGANVLAVGVYTTQLNHVSCTFLCKHLNSSAMSETWQFHYLAIGY